MPVNTCPSNTDSHPGLVDRPSQQTRHSRKQIEEDDTHTLSAANSARKEAEAKHQAAIQLIAMTEDAIEWEQQDVLRYMTRPDLRPDPKTLAEEVESGAESEMGLVLIIAAIPS
jgi:hypothetical protein